MTTCALFVWMDTMLASTKGKGCIWKLQSKTHTPLLCVCLPKGKKFFAPGCCKEYQLVVMSSLLLSWSIHMRVQANLCKTVKKYVCVCINLHCQGQIYARDPLRLRISAMRKRKTYREERHTRTRQWISQIIPHFFGMLQIGAENRGDELYTFFLTNPSIQKIKRSQTWHIVSNTNIWVSISLVIWYLY